MKKKPSKIIISCEHASNAVPSAYHQLFKAQIKTLKTHLGWDIGAFNTAKYLAKHLKCPAFYGEVTRLLIDLNRSIHNPKVFSKYANNLSLLEKQKIINKLYTPYRDGIINTINDLHHHNFSVCHLSIHSFTPQLNNEVRNNDIGLLYDPKRPAEKTFANNFKKMINQTHPHLKVRMNYPYKGTSDGLTTHLRKRFHKNYIGIEIEINQKHFIHDDNNKALSQIILSTIKSI